MNRDYRYKNLGYSVLFIALCCALVYFFFSLNSNTFSGLSIWFLFVLIHYLGIGVGGILIIFRFLSILKRKDSFIYIFFSILNIGIGLSNLGFVIFSDVAQSSIWVYLFFNLLLGAASFIDTFLIDQLDSDNNNFRAQL